MSQYMNKTIIKYKQGDNNDNTRKEQFNNM